MHAPNEMTTCGVWCYRCRSSQAPGEFINQWGRTVQRCKSCRGKDSKQRKERYNQRKSDETDFLETHAKKAKAWLAKPENKERVSKRRTLSFRHRFGAIKSSAVKKGLTWHESMTDEICELMMKAPCFYCGDTITRSLHGIDRVDNNQGYGVANCVTCCGTCNFLKRCLDPTTFIERCLHISYVHGGMGAQYPTSWATSGCSGYGKSAWRARNKGMSFELTKADYLALTSSACHYCCRASCDGHTNGIDRKDNARGYEVDNVVPCCGECNRMKSTLGDTDFIQQCMKIAFAWQQRDMPFPNVPRCTSVIAKRAK